MSGASLSWFKVGAACYSDPQVLRLAHALQIDRVTALGLITATEAHLTSFSPAGEFDAIAEHLPALFGMSIADDVLMTTLRKVMADEHGTCVSYLERNQSAFENADKARKRAAQYRKAQREGRVPERSSRPHGDDLPDDFEF